MKKTTIFAIIMSIIFSSTGTFAKFQSNTIKEAEQRGIQLLKSLDIEPTDLKILITNGEMTKKILMVSYRTPLAEPKDGRFGELIAVAQISMILNESFNTQIDHSWITVEDYSRNSIANFAVPSEAARKYRIDDDLGPYLDTWLAIYVKEEYFKTLQGVVNPASSDEKKSVKLAKVIIELETALSPETKTKQTTTPSDKNKRNEKFFREMKDDKILHSIESETSNPIIFIGTEYLKLGKELQNKFLGAVYASFLLDSHPGFEKLIVYNPASMQRLGIYDKNGFKPDK